MQRPAFRASAQTIARSLPRPDRATALAFSAFAAAACIWIGVMAQEQGATHLQATTIVLSQNVSIAIPSAPVIALADLSR